MEHRLDEVAGHARELQESGHIALDQRPDDVVHVAARGEVAAGAADHEGFDVLVFCRFMEEIAELGITVESQRIFALRPVQRDRRDALVDAEEKVPGRVAGQRQE